MCSEKCEKNKMTLKQFAELLISADAKQIEKGTNDTVRLHMLLTMAHLAVNEKEPLNSDTFGETSYKAQ